SREETTALGWTLLHFCWQGTAVAVAYAMVDRMTLRAGSKLRYVVALAALMVMPAIVAGTFAMEMQAAAPAGAEGQAVLQRDFEKNPEINASVQATPILHEIPLATSLVEKPTNWLTLRAERLLPWVDGMWLAGVFLLAIRSLGGWFQLEYVRRRARSLVPEELERGFRRICKQVRVGRSVVLRISDEVISPLAMGVWRVTVILPASAVLGLPAEELEAVMAHELGHIRRWDYLWNLMQMAVESVLFFHPVVWWLSRTVRERREVCCDEIAVRSCAGAEVYARALLRLEEQRTVDLRLAMALTGCGGSLLGRVRKVLGEDMAMESRMTSGVSVAAAGALVIALLLGPKVGEAVAAPMMAAAQPVVAQVATVLPRAVVSKMIGADLRVAVPVAPKVVEAPEAPEASAPKKACAAKAVSIATALPQTRVAFLQSEDFVLTNATRVNTNAVVRTLGGSIFAMELQTPEGKTTPKGIAYLDGMRDAGYPLDLSNDLNSLVALKSVGVTPEYAKSMNAAGLGKPTVHDLIALKSMGVTPEYVATMKQSGIAPKDFHEVVTEKSLGITPEYAAELKQKGFGNLSLHEMISMKSMGVTPEYAAEMKKGFGDLSVHELISMKSMDVTPEYAAEMKQKGFGDLSVHDLIAMKSMGVTPEYAAEMKQKGFGDLNVHQLISLKSQGLTPEYAGWLKQQFPQATVEELHKAAMFHVDEKFVADAKAHGFDGKDLNKLVRLKMSGLLD
ncbi:MAG TPA: M56 family metallopeptidase, partial [Edaphobacter sp.]|nr:M56 family metallopeptidase [Edaphobacter sp.]